jgi:hypothetical protein
MSLALVGAGLALVIVAVRKVRGSIRGEARTGRAGVLSR